MAGQVVRAFGIVQLIVGVVAAFYGPMEIYVFYFFSSNGRFHYDGFGVGSFWFGLLVVHNIAYYIVAGLLLPTGYGTIRRRRWALTLSRLILWLWLGGGALLLLNLIVLTPAILQMGLARNVLFLRLSIVFGFVVLLFIGLPVLLLRFYRAAPVGQYFTAQDERLYWTERTPFPLLVLFVLLAAVVLALHLAIFFQAIFPVWGTLLMGRTAVYVIDTFILILLGLIFGLVKRQVWAWWGALAYFSWLTLSSLLTFGRLTFNDIIGRMNLPAFELEWLARVTILDGYRLVWLLIGPLLAILGLLLATRHYFTAKN